MKLSTLPFLLSFLLPGIHAHQGHGKQEFDPKYIETLNYKWNFDVSYLPPRSLDLYLHHARSGS